jgi:hypothetical protein
MTRTLTTALLLLGAVLIAAPAFADGDDARGYGMGPGRMGYGGGMGPGMMGGGYGMGPGMMGGGMMGGGMGMGMNPFSMHPELAQLPPEKQEQLRKLHFSMMQTMILKRADLQVKSLALSEVMRSFPVDQKAARAQWAELNKARQEMFELRLSMMAQVQQIVGKELWERMHDGVPFRGGPYGGGPGAGSGQGMMGGGSGAGPGMMGPQQPR